MTSSIGSDKAVLEKLQSNNVDVSLYTRCTNRCTLPVLPPVDNVADSTVTVTLQAGYPKVVGDHVKKIIIESNGTTHTMSIIVVGDFGHDGNSFPFPTHLPVLILRDPPGGLSSVTYSNFETTVILTMENYEKYAGVDAEFNLGTEIKQETAGCVGFGATFCTNVQSANIKIGAKQTTEETFLKKFKDDSHSTSLTITWSYSTAGSDASMYAGKDSDVFLVPTLSILHRKTDTVLFNETLCKASKISQTKFDVKAAENKRTISFLSYRQVLTEVLPELKGQIEIVNAQKEVNVSQAEALNFSLSAWTDTLRRYEEVNANNTLENVGKWYQKNRSFTCEKRAVLCEDRDEKILNLYEYKCDSDKPDQNIKVACEKFKESPCDPVERSRCVSTEASAWKILNSNHEFYSMLDFEDPALLPSDSEFSLLSNAMLEKAEPLDGAVSLTSSLESTGRIQFSGGGNILSLTFEDEDVDRIMSKWDNGNDRYMYDGDGNDYYENADRKYYAGLMEEAQLNYKYGVFLEGYQTGGASITHRTSISSEQIKGSSISVEFGDADVGDEFLVDIFLDPMYNTLVFRTVEGQSKCPNERGTRAIERPGIQVLKRPKFVMEDELMVFDVELLNEGDGDSSFYLFTNNLENTDGLTTSVNGFNIADPLVFFLPRQSSSKIATTIEIGPKQHVYNSISIMLKSKCEYDQEYGPSTPAYIAESMTSLYNEEIDGVNKISFVEECNQLKLAGTLEEERTFVVNSQSNHMLEVTFQNPLFSTRKLKDVKRLTNVGVQYRMNNNRSEPWNIGKYLSKGEILENNFGYVTFIWKVPLDISDGPYEIRLVSTCTTHGEAPEKFNSFQSEPLLGFIDRNAPGIYGLPSPMKNLIPGEELQIRFTEEIDCNLPYLFKINITVSGLKKVFQNDDTNIFCSGNMIGIVIQESSVPGRNNTFLAGKIYQLQLSEVRDRSRNILQNYEYTSTFSDDIGLGLGIKDRRLSLQRHLQMGCDQIDNNENMLVDECDEHLIPPIIELSSVIRQEKNHRFLSDFVGYGSKTDVVHIMSHCFDTPISAKMFLQQNINGKDECSHDVLIDIVEVKSWPTKQGKNHIYNIVEFLVTATDSHCGPGPSWSSNMTVFVEVFDRFDANVKRQGCNGLDDNCDGFVDDCSEDQSPPVISISESVTLHESTVYSGMDVITSHCFRSSADALSFLTRNVHVEDDCAQELHLDFKEVSLQHSLEKNHDYKLTQFIISAVDNRCGAGAKWSANRTVLVEVFHKYQHMIKNQGCNGIDENCDGIIDDCSEDGSPPIIHFKDGLSASIHEPFDGITIIEGVSFTSINDAYHFLKGNIVAEDDCSNDLSIEVSFPAVENCSKTVFTVTAYDNRCFKAGSIHTVMKKIAVMVDNISPSVSIGFDRIPHSHYFDENGLYLHIDESSYDYEDINLWYNVTVSSFTYCFLPYFCYH